MPTSVVDVDAGGASIAVISRNITHSFVERRKALKNSKSFLSSKLLRTTKDCSSVRETSYFAYSALPTSHLQANATQCSVKSVAIPRLSADRKTAISPQGVCLDVNDGSAMESDSEDSEGGW